MWDRHGKHRGHENVDDTVRDLIRSFPEGSSHYSRSDNSGRVYLPSDLSIVRLCRDFLQNHDPKLQEENRECGNSHQSVQQICKPIVTLHFYHDLFVTVLYLLWLP